MHIFSLISKKMTVQQRRRLRKTVSPFRRMGLHNKTFSLISNNCWGGIVYDKFGLQYRTPTIGLLLGPSDYIKFVTHLSYYLSFDAVVDHSEDGKEVRNGNDNNLFYGKFGDIRLYFVHYRSAEDAVVKWKRRRKRVDLGNNNIFVELSDISVAGEQLTDEEIGNFARLPYQKVFFTANKTWADKYQFAVLFHEIGSDGKLVNEFRESNSLFPLSRLKKTLNTLKNISK